MNGIVVVVVFVIVVGVVIGGGEDDVFLSLTLGYFWPRVWTL